MDYDQCKPFPPDSDGESSPTRATREVKRRRMDKFQPIQSFICLREWTADWRRIPNEDVRHYGGGDDVLGHLLGMALIAQMVH